mgnify:CR=1 FL=1
MSPKPLVAGNWKMNGLQADAVEIETLARLRGAGTEAAADVLICPPATLIAKAVEVARGSRIAIGAQDCHTAVSGAHTGDISAAMLRDLGCSHVIVGHSERRSDHGETDAIVRAKAEAALAAGLQAIICVGETESERDAGQTLDIIGAQLQGSVPDAAAPATVTLAYEPVWAIGTGRTPTEAEVAAVHGFIRARLVARFGEQAAAFRLLYGGSVKPSNAGTLMAVADVDGALVGGASLKAADFDGILAAYRQVS